MEITSVSSSSSTVLFAPAKAAASPAETSDSDQSMVNISPDTFSSFVQQASAEPEVRQNLVDHFKSQISSGSYPPSDIVSGLTHLIGAGVYQMAMGSSAST